MDVSNATLLPEYRVTFIRSEVENSLDWMIKAMRTRDTELTSRFVRDDKNPDYIIASDKCLYIREDCMRLRDYLRRRRDSIFIFFSLECIEPDMNIFDYAFTWNPDLVCGDRIGCKVPYIYGADCECITSTIFDFCTNDLTREDARKMLESNLGFCNFMYSHMSNPRDEFFHLISRYKHIDSLGAYLHNTNINKKTTRHAPNWYSLSVKMKAGYKFSIAMENASSKGYTTEKIISSLQAHTVPIYWGDPAVTDFINPKAFINCNDYSSFDEVIERVKEIDNDDELWIDIVTQPWQTEEQHDKTLRMLDENDVFIRNIFTQDIKKARRRGVGFYPDMCRKRFTGLIGIMPPIYVRVARKIRLLLGKFVPDKMKPAVKKLLHMD